MQTARANQLLVQAGVVIPEEGAGIPELQRLQQHLEDKYKICVYQHGSKGRDVMFEGVGSTDVTLNILQHQGHYNVITSLTAAFCCEYYCQLCHIPYNTRSIHRCGGSCYACQQTPACPQGIKLKCGDCNRWFKSRTCLDNHRMPNSLGKNTVCGELKCCTKCLRTVRTDRVHTCGEVYCKICNSHQPQDHLCFMQPDTGSPTLEGFLFVFYDLETRQEKVLDENTVEHEPNLCVIKQCCEVCINSSDAVCEKCGVKTMTIKNNVIDNFVGYILNKRQVFKKVVVIAHNGQAFDHQFVLNHVLTKTNLIPELIMRGTKIISMTIGNVKFLDSLNYFPMALAKLPKTFGLGSELQKGYFPHYFNTLENTNYVGPLPDASYYSPDTMKEPERATFLAWYEEHKHDEFNMCRDLESYCVSDVDILMRACLKFREQLISASNVCPFTEACTIASTCNKVFRRNFLKPNTIGIIPRGGYRFRDVQSHIATQWLVWLEHTRGINIVHAAKDKEARLGGLKVDGYCENTNQLFEFHGCYFHGHPACQKYNRDTPGQRARRKR